MVAETHSSFEELNHSEIARFVLEDLGDLSNAVADSTTIADCGFRGILAIAELAEILGEEFGERTLLGAEVDDITEDWTVTELVDLLYGPSSSEQ